MNVLIFCLVVLMVMTASVLAEKDPDISDIMSPEQKNMALNVLSYRQAGTIHLAGLKGTFESYFVAPNKMYQTVDLGIMKMAQGYDGYKAWMLDPNGQYVELTGMEYKIVMNSIYVMNYTFLREGAEWPIFMGGVLINNIPYYEFKAYPPGGDSVILYVGEQTGRLEMVRSFLDEITLVTHLEDFQEIEGYFMPMTSWTESSNPLLNDTMFVSETEINPEIDGSLFAMSLDHEVDYVFGEDVDSVEVPIIYEKGYIMFRATVNDTVAALFILDTGAGMNALDKRFADRIGLDAAGGMLAKGAAGYGEAAIASLDSVAIGKITLYDQKIAVIDFYAQNLRFGDDFAGLMGFDFVSRFPLKIDFSRRIMTAYNANIESPVHDGAVIPFRTMMKVPIIEASMGNCAGDFLVDLGNPLGVIMHKTFIDNCQFSEGLIESREQMTVGGVGGATTAIAATGHDFRIGEVEVKTIPMVITDGTEGLLRSANVDGNIGTAFWEKFTVLFDYKRNALHLLPVDIK